MPGMWMSSVTTSGFESGELLQRLHAVAREMDLEIAGVGEHAAQQLAHQGRVVDHQNLDHEGACAGAFELVEQAALGAGQKLGRIEQENDPSLGLDVDHAIDQPRDVLGQVRRGFDGVGSRTQHLGDAVDDQAGAMAFGPHDDQPTPVALFEPRHVETPSLVHHRQDHAAQIDDAFQKLGRLGHARDPIRHARHFLDRLDRQAEFVVAQPEHQELPLLARLRRPAVAAAMHRGLRRAVS